jgi:hypothetical protein
MVEMPTKDKVIGYLGVGAGIAVGYMLSGMFLKLSDRLKTFIGGVFNKGERSTTGLNEDWSGWASKLLALLIWGSIAIWGYSKWTRDDGAMNGFIMGVGIGGVAEELLYSFGDA